MRLSSINLNLLVALDALLDEQNVSNAAKRLNLTQSQLSHALKQLREIFDDDLLIVGPKRQMLLTEKANSLILPVNKAMNDIEEIFEGLTPFDPSNDQTNFTIAVNSYFYSRIIPGLLKVLDEQAPGMSLNIKEMDTIDDYSRFCIRNLDLAIGAYRIDSSNINCETISQGTYVCSVSKKHPIATKKKLTVHDLKQYPLLLITSNGSDYGKEVCALVKKNVGKNCFVRAVTPYVMATLEQLNDLKHICISNSIFAEKFAERLKLLIFDVPFKTPVISFTMNWKRIDDSSKPHKWLLDNIRRIISDVY